jgi:hypothetical protein
MRDGININVEPKDGEVFVKYQEPTEYIEQPFRYHLRSTQSLIDLIKSRGYEEYSQIFYMDSGGTPRVEVIMDDSIDDRDKDTAIYPFEHSDELKEWEDILDRQIGQKDFIDFLNRRDPEQECPAAVALLGAVQQLKIATQITGDYSYDDNNNYTFGIKVRDTENFTRIPSVIEIHVPILNESDLIADIPIELEITKPKDQTEKPTFKLSCPRLQRYIKTAVKYEIDKIREALPGYNIMAGSPRQDISKRGARSAPLGGE